MKLGIFTLWSCSDGKEMLKKKRGARAECLFCQSKPIAFLPSSLTSPSSLLKLPILLWRSPGDEVAQTREAEIAFLSSE